MVFDELLFFVGQSDGRIPRNLGLHKTAADVDRLPRFQQPSRR
jgi:hypothetical protein